MDALVQPIHGLVVNPSTKEQEAHNANLRKHGVAKLFRRRCARPKSVRELAWEQIQEEKEWNDDRETD